MWTLAEQLDDAQSRRIGQRGEEPGLFARHAQ
jgi:hypothetical protein